MHNFLPLFFFLIHSAKSFFDKKCHQVVGIPTIQNPIKNSIQQYENDYSIYVEKSHLSGSVFSHMYLSGPLDTTFWKPRCRQVVLFLPNPAEFAFDLPTMYSLLNSGHRKNCIIYILGSPEAMRTFLQIRIILMFDPFQAAVVLIYPKIRALYDPRTYKGREIAQDQSSFKGILAQRSQINKNQNRVPIWTNFMDFHIYDCINLRLFLANGVSCFPAYAALQIVGKRLNFTFWDNRYSRFNGFEDEFQYVNLRLLTEPANLDRGGEIVIEKTIEIYALYCQKKPTLLRPLFSKFFTIMDPYVWTCFLVVSFLLGITSLGGYQYAIVAFLKQPVSSER